AFFSVGVDLGFDSIRKALSGSGSASLNLPSISANGHIEIATKSAADSYVGTYTLFARLKPKKSVLLPDVVQVGSVPLNTLVGTGVGLQPTFSMSSRNETGEVLIATTGDEFVQAVEYGAWVMVTMKFEYLNAQDKIDIGGQIAVSFAGVVEVDADGNYVDIENAQSVNVSIIAKQVGGDPDQLPGVLSTSIISCTLDAPENCLDVFAAAATYVRQDFPAQFQADSLEGYNVTRYFTSRYDESGPVLASYMPDNYTNEQTFNSKIALRAMSSRWERALLDARRADYLLNNSVAYLSAGEVTQIASLKTLANANATALSAAITTCKGGAPDDCNTVWADQTWLQSYDQTVLDI
ncbi:MAG: hypothetical protein HRT35_25160, partial [Algicola sp.]|nr:hypothetical protein [Algicola sp.]